MKRLVTVVCLVIAASLITALPAEAGGRSYRCDSQRWHTYIGLESPVLHLRWGDLKAHMRVCYRKSNGTILHKKTRASVRVIPNGVSDTWGTTWNTYHSRQGYYYDSQHQNYQDTRYVMGTFRNCQGIGSARVCGPTGHFTVHLTYTQKRLRAWEPGNHTKWQQQRYSGEPYVSPGDWFDRKVRFYNTP